MSKCQKEPSLAGLSFALDRQGLHEDTALSGLASKATLKSLRGTGLIH